MSISFPVFVGVDVGASRTKAVVLDADKHLLGYAVVITSQETMMNLGQWITTKDILKVNAFKFPDKIAIKDLDKEYTFKQWNEQACRLANALAAMGLKKGDRFAVLAYNCIEWMEIYAAAAKGGFI
jgi:acyl-coenzyme A synthetase/AMP-(fatty) acid ligase